MRPFDSRAHDMHFTDDVYFGRWLSVFGVLACRVVAAAFGLDECGARPLDE